MTRARVLALYRQILNTHRNWKGPKQERDYIISEARTQFKANKALTDSEEIEKKIFEAQSRLEMALHYKIPFPRLHHKLSTHRRISLMTPSDRFTKEETERVIRGDFKGLADALELMRKRKQGPQVVGRWDWHLWMFLISTCLPCFGVYCLAMWVRSGLWEEHRKRETAKQDSSNKPDPTQQRISALERELQYLRYLVLLGSPKLTPETVQRMIPGNQSTKEVKEAPSEERSPVQKTSWSDRVWLRIKKWLPFYVEPYYDQKTDHHQNSGLSTVFKSEK